VEEAPSSVLTPELRERMGAAAVAAARAVAYQNAGTIEFLFQDGDFFFLEMNTRIQVEHPVTELVTGIDLVQWQLRIASGEPLPFRQDQIRLQGHAIECGAGIRWDGGVEMGSEVSLYYDPMLAKLIVHAADRANAIARMQRALEELTIVGIETSASFHRRVLREPDFRAGRLSIRYIEEHPDLVSPQRSRAELRLAAIAAALLEEEKASRKSVPRISRSQQTSSWRDHPGERSNGWRG
jgi:acetyl/propionyl-CoA carboxylase alpha subunit